MGIDHGLGGRDNKKSREKRERRLAKKTAKAKYNAHVGKKKEVVFDEEARASYLTGFRQRKKERRQFGVAMQVLKDKKQAREKRMKNIVKATEDDTVSEVENKTETEGDAVDVTFTDERTTEMFGGEVSVVIDSNIAEQMDEESCTTQSTNHKRSKVITPLDRAMKKANKIIHMRTVNKRNNKHNRSGKDGQESYGRKGSAAPGSKRSKR